MTNDVIYLDIMEGPVFLDQLPYITPPRCRVGRKTAGGICLPEAPILPLS